MAGNQHVQDVIDQQNLQIKLIEKNCINQYGQNLKSNTPIFNKTLNSIMCPPFFDNIYCWPPQLPNTTTYIPCPSYVVGFKQDHEAKRECMENGKWFTLNGSTFTNYLNCAEVGTTTIYLNTSIDKNETEISQTSLNIIKILSETGYAISLVSLIIAFTIMFKIKRLHCARNILHMNLFASFILRSFMHILKDALFEDGLGLEKDILTNDDGGRYFHVDFKVNNFECKLIISLVQYFTAANYSWILMEGLYLINLILRALFTDSNKNLAYYISFGWGLPLLVVIPWVITRIMEEDTYCWTTNKNPKVFSIIFVPTLASVLLNFILFIIISNVLYKKLKSPVNEESKRYLKWAKSTLVLMPLFGVNYTVFLIFYLIDEKLIWMICDSLFGSFQGFFVAILYCFSNGEVKAEIKPHIKNLLIFLATNNFTKYCFPGREKYLSSAVGRQSVCTTMSCSSLYNNGVSRRNSKTKCDQLSKFKLTNLHSESCKDTLKNGKGRHSVPKTGHNGHYTYNVTLANGKYPISITTNLDVSITNEIKPNPISENLPKCEEEVRMLQDHNKIERCCCEK